MTGKINDGGPAFPVTEIDQATGGLWAQYLGLSARDWFAGQALAAIMADGPLSDGERWDLIAQNAYFAADAMLVERSKPQSDAVAGEEGL